MMELVKLGELTRIRTGKLDANASSENGEYPFFTCSKEPLKISTYSYDCECVLVAGNGDLNVKYYNGKFDAYQRTYIIESVSSKRLLVKYLYYFLDLYIETLRNQSIGGVIKYIKLGNLTDAKIPLPEIEKQKEIVTQLEKSQQSIDKRRQQLRLLEELVKSQFIEMFGDPMTNPKGYELVSLSDMGVYFNGLTYKPENVVDEGMVVLRSSNIQEGTLDFADIVRVDITPKEKLLVRDGDILMCSRNGSAKLVGKVALIKDLQEPMTFGAFMMIIRANNPEYLLNYFRTAAFREQIKTGATTTINQITSSMLDKVRLPKPSLAEMNCFARFTQQTDKSKVPFEKQRNYLKLLQNRISTTKTMVNNVKISYNRRKEDVV